MVLQCAGRDQHSFLFEGQSCRRVVGKVSWRVSGVLCSDAHEELCGSMWCVNTWVGLWQQVRGIFYNSVGAGVNFSRSNYNTQLMCSVWQWYKYVCSIVVSYKAVALAVGV